MIGAFGTLNLSAFGLGNYLLTPILDLNPLRFADYKNEINQYQNTTDIGERPSDAPVSSPDERFAYFRCPVYIERDMETLVFSFNNWFMGPNFADGEAAGNTLTVVAAALEVVEEDGTTSMVKPITFSGSRSYTLADGEARKDADPITKASIGKSVIPRGARYFAKGKLSVPNNGDNFVRTLRRLDEVVINGTNQAQFRLYDDSATTVSDVDVSGVFTETGTTSASGLGMFAPIVLGNPTSVDDIASWVIIGDSLTYLTYPDVEEVTTQAPPALNMAVAGMAAQTMNNNFTKWEAYLDCADAAYVYHGTNDIGANTDASIVTASLATMYANLKALDNIDHVVASDLAVITSSTDDWATKANQTKGTKWQAGAMVDTVRQWLAARAADNTLYSLVDTSFAKDPTDEWLWLTDGVAELVTPDGIHFGGRIGAALMNSAMLAALRTYQVDEVNPMVPNKVKNVAANIDGTDVVVTFDATDWNGGSAVTNYIVEYKAIGDSTWTANGGTSTSTTQTLSGLSGVLADKEFRVRAVNAAGSSVASAASRAVGFDITAVTGAHIYLDPRDPANITITSGVITGADNEIGTPDFDTQDTPKSPTYGTSGGDLINGNNTIKFDGVDDFLRILSAGFTSTMTLVLVFKADADQDRFDILCDGSGAAVIRARSGSGFTSINQSVGSPTYYVNGVLKTTGAGNDWETRGDVWTDLSSANGTVCFTAHNFNGSTIESSFRAQLGYKNNASEAFKGLKGGVFVGNSISNDDRIAIENELMSIWGIS